MRIEDVVPLGAVTNTIDLFNGPVGKVRRSATTVLASQSKCTCLQYL